MALLAPLHFSFQFTHAHMRTHVYMTLRVLKVILILFFCVCGMQVLNVLVSFRFIFSFCQTTVGLPTSKLGGLFESF
jgi:hypothetical protein